ncbi:class I SAM-dependent DNA methyltransferase [Pseudonocardia phyllosphaerae]|uniref:class I SAM-dependent DNA methyltransferase n=1 Tax=Pseudonocardia phyllosphaerae TaxID=3390502 RepID=UPI0039796F4E
MPDIDRLKGTIRSLLALAFRVAILPIRVVVLRLQETRPELRERTATWSWLWQPGWSRSVYESHYRGGADPDGYAVRDYEQGKFRDQLAALGERRFARGLEVGCAEGVFTEKLAGICDELVAVDISDVAAARARERCTGHDGVRVERMNLPFVMPDGTFDLIVCSDVLYLWEGTTLRFGVSAMRRMLRPGGVLLLQHYLGEFGQALNGDQVHERVLASLHEEPELRVLHRERHPDVGPDGAGAGYRIEVLERVA